MPHYSRDPYWMTARYNDTAEDGTPVRKGDRVFYYPSTRKVFIGARAERAAADFEACRQDEEWAPASGF